MRDNLIKFYTISINVLLAIILFIVSYFFILILLKDSSESINRKILFKNKNDIVNNFFSINYDEEDIKKIFIKKIVYKEFLENTIINKNKKNIKNEKLILIGDNLTNILVNNGIDIKNIMLFINAYPILNNLKPGQKIIWYLNKDNKLEKIKWIISGKKTLVYTHLNKTKIFSKKKRISNCVWVKKRIYGVIRDNFIKSAMNAGLTYNEISEVSKALKWQVNLQKLQFGDKFVVLLKRKMHNGYNIQSKLLGVHFLKNSKSYYAFRAENGRYYDSEANCLERNFLRNPTFKNFKVSSPFSFNRINPITGRESPHKGVDFSMPSGTPILSVADGTVVEAKYSNAAGNFVIIRHDKKYTSRYMHLDKILVKKGQNVKIGMVIAFSGNTGRATGPHLHYELWLNKKALNPLTANLNFSDKLIGKDKKMYLSLIKKDKLKLIFD